MKVTIPVSLGELYDKQTILRIKTERIKDTEKLINIQKELDLLIKIIDEHPINDPILYELYNVNNRLWAVEDNLRDREHKQLFDEGFINSARLVYQLNDRRSEIKKEINLKYSSDITEEKSYTKYK